MAQSTSIQVGQGAPTTSISEEFVQAYLRSQFFTLVATPPLTEVAAYGSGGYRQEFQDIGRTGLRFALIRPANPNLSLGVNNIVRQVRPPITAVLNRSSIGVATAGFPLIDTTEFLFVPPGLANAQVGGSYQTFDKNFAIFVWSAAPLAAEGSDVVEMTVADPVFTKWNTVGYESLGAPVSNAASVTSRFNTNATTQRFVNGAIYVLTSGSFSGRAILVRRNVLELYLANQAQAGFLGLPLGDETILADGRRRQSFEGGTVEYVLNGTPVLKNAVQTVSIAGDNPIRLAAGQSFPLQALLVTSAGERVEDREVFWTTSNGLVATISGSGPRANLQALRGGTAIIRATSEGKTSAALTVYVTGICCALGEGAPTQVIAQSFQDAAQRNRLALRTPLASPVRRLGAGYIQEAILSANGARVLLAKPDASPQAFVVSGALLAAHDGAGGVTGALGFPLGDASEGGTQLFAGGALAGVPVRSVSGAILTRWRALGLEVGALGGPLANATSVLSFTGNSYLVQRFANGILVQHLAGALAGRALVVSGPLAAKFLELGGASGVPGAPLTEEFVSAGVVRQEFEGATLEYAPGQPVRVIEKERRPVLSVAPSALAAGARYRVSIGGFPAGARLRVSPVGNAAEAFEVSTPSGAYSYESVVPANARPGTVVLRASNTANAQNFAEGSYTVRSLAELRPQLSKLSGDQQSGAPATILAAPLRVQLLDAAGNPLANAPVRFEASPGGAVLEAESLTNAEGVAQALWRLPAQSGIALLTVQSSGATATFSARAAAYTIASFPRLSQDVDGFLGNTSASIRRKGSMLAALAAIVRFYQQRGVVPREAGLADVQALNAFLRSYCESSPSGAAVCDGYLSADAATDPVPNPLRLFAYSSGVLDFEAFAPQMDALRQSVFADTPAVLALELSLPGQAPTAHFVAATGIDAGGDVLITDSHPEFSRSTLAQYLNGLATAAGAWRVRWIAAFRFVPRGVQSSAFFVYGNSAPRVRSSAPACQPALSWPGVYADAAASVAANAAGSTFYLVACAGNGGAYQLDVPGPFLLSLNSSGVPARQSLVSGAADASYAVLPDSGTWSLGPMALQASVAGVVQAASFQPLLAPGSILSIFGAGLPQGNDAADAVLWNGQRLPIFFSDGFQLNTALPEGEAGPGTLQLASRFGAQSLALETQPLAPAIFSLGNGGAAIVNQDGSLNSPQSPAVRGQFITLYGTGFGSTEGGSGNLRNILVPPTIQFEDSELRPQFAGLAPGFVGLYQLNVLLPGNLRPGLNQNIRLRQGSVSSPDLRISVR